MADTVARPRPERVPARVVTALMALGQALAVAAILAIGSRETGWPGYGAYLFAFGFGAVLLWRERFPVAVLTAGVLGIFAYYIADYPPIGMALPVVGGFYAAAERGRVMVATGAAAVLLSVSLYFRAREGESGAVLAYDVITNAALIGCAIALALTVRSRRALRGQQQRMVALERRHQQERAARQLEEERLKIARDVHDSIGHALALVSVQARVAQQSLGSDDAAAGRALDSVVQATGSSLADLRRTLAMLQPDDAGGPTWTVSAAAPLDGIERTAQAARDAGLEVELRLDADPSAIPTPIADAAFRIVQESVTNVLRHARARHLRVIVGATGNDLRVEVADDGVGAGARTMPGRGIQGMRERAALLGGEVTAGSSPTGFRVDATLPIRRTDAADGTLRSGLQP